MRLISTNPSRNYEVIGEVEASTEQEIKDAVVKARNVFPKWSGLKLSERCKLISSFIKVSEKRFEEIAKIISLETGRPIVSARENVQGGIDYFTSYIEMA